MESLEKQQFVTCFEMCVGSTCRQPTAVFTNCTNFTNVLPVD